MAVWVNIYATKIIESFMTNGPLSERREKYYAALFEKYGDTYISTKLGAIDLPSELELLDDCDTG